MKDNKTKLAFIRARSEGKSYNLISKELGISKATCTEWNKSLKDEIATLKDEHTEELYTTYKMSREARIKDLGETLERIDNALQAKDLKDLPIEKLLDYKLKYREALKAEYIEPVEEPDQTLDGLMEEFNRILKATSIGQLTPATAKAQLAVLEARKETITAINYEKKKEKEGVLVNDFEIEIGTREQYTSDLLRHPEE